MGAADMIQREFNPDDSLAYVAAVPPGLTPADGTPVRTTFADSSSARPYATEHIAQVPDHALLTYAAMLLLILMIVTSTAMLISYWIHRKNESSSLRRRRMGEAMAPAEKQPESRFEPGVKN